MNWGHNTYFPGNRCCVPNVSQPVPQPKPSPHVLRSGIEPYLIVSQRESAGPKQARLFLKITLVDAFMSIVIEYLILKNMGALILNITSTDRTIAERWRKAFQKEGWLVVIDAACYPGEENRVKRAEVALIEISSPGCRNLEELKSILQARQPVSTLVFGDPQKISNSQIAAFLDAGADDFIYKNLDERILVAKLKAHMRRIMPAIAETCAKLATSSGDIEIDRGRRAVKIETNPGKYTELLNLTQKELDILAMLIAQERQIVSRESMLEKLWGEGADSVYSECIDKHIESLRKKLGLYGRRIKTVYGSGYLFTENGTTRHGQ